MRIIHITYTDGRMTKSAELCSESALKMGADFSSIKDQQDVDMEFSVFNQKILSQDRGAGYWLWKSYLILQTMFKMEDGDVLVYTDAGIEIVAQFSNIISLMEQDIFFFTNGHSNAEWSKMDILETIIPGRWNIHQRQIQASVIFFKVNDRTKDLVKEWLLYCQLPGLIDDSPSKERNVETFAENRHDQSILTAVAIKRGYEYMRWWPTQYSNHLIRSERDNYPVMFNHHRKRNQEWPQLENA